MTLGIFAKTFARVSFSEVLGAVAEHDLNCIQFNFASVGLPSLPEAIPDGLVTEIRSECEQRQIAIAGVSATFNMIHPDPAQRHRGLRGLEMIAPMARALGCRFISLCTGTRDAHDMWRGHPDNASSSAWSDLRASMEVALQTAERHDVLLGMEPEFGNVVSDVRRARQLLDELKAPRLKVILDSANLLHPGRLDVMRETIQEAAELLAPDMVMAHAKELGPNGEMGEFAPGQGVIDWPFYFECLRGIGFAGPMIIHGLPEKEVAGAVKFLKGLAG